MRAEGGALMKIAKLACIWLLILTGGRGLVGQSTRSKTEAEDVRAAIAGVWRGHSVCVERIAPAMTR